MHPRNTSSGTYCCHARNNDTPLPLSSFRTYSPTRRHFEPQLRYARKTVSNFAKRARRKISKETWLKKAAFLVQSKLATGLVIALAKTLKITAHNMPAADYHCVFAFWHRNLMILMIHRRQSGIAVIVSTSDAGRTVAGPLKELGYVTVRGSSTRRGSQALIKLVRLLKERSVAITPDGPSGPRGTIQPGVFQLAMLAKAPIIPVTIDCDKEWVMRSWDRFRLPKPFSRITVHYGDPIWVTDKDAYPAYEEELRAKLTDL